MIENEQELAEIVPQEPPEQTIATIVNVSDTGIVLDFGEKEYSCNQGIKFSAGQRVLVEKRSGTYIVICPIGPPAKEIVVDKAAYADTAGTAQTAETAKSADTAKTAQSATNADTAQNATTADTASFVASASGSGQKIQFSYLSGILSFRIGSSGAFMSKVESAETADSVEAVKSPVSSTEIEFNYSAGSLYFRTKGSSAWIKLQNG